jgi:hypothetical protein
LVEEPKAYRVEGGTLVQYRQEAAYQMTQKITITLDPEPFRVALENTASLLCAMQPEVADAVLKDFSCGFLFQLPIVPTGEPGCYVLRAESLPWEFGRKVADAINDWPNAIRACGCSRGLEPTPSAATPGSTVITVHDTVSASDAMSAEAKLNIHDLDVIWKSATQSVLSDGLPPEEAVRLAMAGHRKRVLQFRREQFMGKVHEHTRQGRSFADAFESVASQVPGELASLSD